MSACPDKNVKFKWQAYNLDTKKWSRIADWNGGNWATWKPQPGNYWLHVEAANGDGGFDEQTICFAVSTDFSKNYIDLNGIAMIDKSSLYQVGVTYSSNDSDVQFRWLQYDVVNNHWSLVSDWNKSNWTNWYPKNGTYWIYVEARTSDGVVNSMTQGVIVNR